MDLIFVEKDMDLKMNELKKWISFLLFFKIKERVVKDCKKKKRE